MVLGLSAQYAVLFVIAMLMTIGFFQVWVNERRFAFKELYDIIICTAQTCILISIACMSAGIISGVVNMTGLGVHFAHILLEFSQSFVFILLMVMSACLVLGMGLPSTAAYSIVALVCAPILISFGVEKLTAHLFVFYFSIISFITPPIGIASYAAATIAKSSFGRTSIQAFLLGFAGFVVPFLFVSRPELLMYNGIFPALMALSISLVGIFILCVAIEGYCIRQLNIIQRIFLAFFALFVLFY